MLTDRIKCESCKELGHRAIDCEKDPNIRTSHDMDDELLRVATLKVTKKRMSDY